MDQFHLNLDSILSDKEVPAFVKNIVGDIKSKGNINVGFVIRDMSTTDILAAIDAFNSLMVEMRNLRDSLDTDAGFQKDKPKVVTFAPKSLSSDTFILFTDILSFGSGIELTSSLSVLGPRFSRLNSILNLEYMRRAMKLPIQIRYEGLSIEGYVPEYKLVLPEYNDLETDILNKIDNLDEAIKAAIGMHSGNKEFDNKAKEILNKAGSLQKLGLGLTLENETVSNQIIPNISTIAGMSAKEKEALAARLIAELQKIVKEIDDCDEEMQSKSTPRNIHDNKGLRQEPEVESKAEPKVETPLEEKPAAQQVTSVVSEKEKSPGPIRRFLRKLIG